MDSTTKGPGVVACAVSVVTVALAHSAQHSKAYACPSGTDPPTHCTTTPFVIVGNGVVTVLVDVTVVGGGLEVGVGVVLVGGGMLVGGGVEVGVVVGGGVDVGVDVGVGVGVLVGVVVGVGVTQDTVKVTLAGSSGLLGWLTTVVDGAMAQFQPLGSLIMLAVSATWVTLYG
jgi:hypothetical protein